jgi:class 3 adenylate cyclase
LQNFLLTLQFDEESEALMQQLKTSQSLLERVLPEKVIPRVKHLTDNSAIADEFNSVTIIFAKVKGIHELFDKLPTVQVVDVIDNLYKRFDALTTEHFVEKIKTVADTYMAGAGLPEPSDDHASNMASFAYDIIKAIENFNAQNIIDHNLSYQIGISSGPVVAGVIGTQNYTYDLWGDAANTASRMYSCGVKGRIQTTKTTVNLLKNEYNFTSRGELNVKGKGMMECFLFDGKKEQSSNTALGSRHHVVKAKVNQRQIRRAYSQTNRRGSFSRKRAPIHMIANLSNDKVVEMMSNKEDLKIGKHLWTEDKATQNMCEECGAKFTMFFRRHHCRFCGRLLCDNCTKHRVYKQRACDQCHSMKSELVNANEMMRKAEENQKEDKMKRATLNFLSPIRAVAHTVRSGTLRKVERDFNIDRKDAINMNLLLFWLLMITFGSIGNMFFTDFYLVNRCVHMKESTRWSTTEIACEKLVLCQTNNFTAGCVASEDALLIYKESDLRAVRIITTSVILPLAMLYIFLTRFPYDIKIEAIAMGVVILMSICIMWSATQVYIYGYYLLIFLALINTYSTVQYFFALILSVVLSIIYVILVLRHHCDTTVGSFKGYLCMDPLDFVVEKFIHIVIVTCVIGYRLDIRHRKMFMKLLGIRKQQETIANEAEKHNKLIALPPVLVDGLRNKKKVVLDAYGTILFADIVSFTVFSTNLPPIRLVQILNDMFAMHDELANRVGVDKVKTLGDCYVACSGVLSPLANHAASMVQFGIGMHWVMAKLNKRHNLNGKGPFGKDLRIRVGCSSGSIVGGVVGGKKFIFDIWGDTVEDAEIMESGGVPERTHVSQTTYIRAVKDSTLKFEKLDRLPEPGYPKEKGETYLAVIPKDVEAWLNGVCGDNDELIDDQYNLVKRVNSTRSIGGGSNRSRSPSSGSLLNSGTSFSNPLFDGSREIKAKRSSPSLEMSSYVDEIVEDTHDDVAPNTNLDPPKLSSAKSFTIHEVTSKGEIIKEIKR